MRWGPAGAMLFTVLLIGPGGCGHGSEGRNAPPPPGSREVNAGGSTAGVAKARREGGDATHYRLNPGKSRFLAHVGVSGLLKAAGHPHAVAIREFGGEVRVGSGMAGPTSITMKIVAGSLAEVGKEFSEKDRQKIDRDVRGEALETSRYPDIVFESRDVSLRRVAQDRYQAAIEGDLSLRGVTRTVSFPADVRIEGDVLRARGEFTILHGDYRLKRLSAAGGTIKASEEIRLSFDIQAERGRGE